MKHKSNHKIKYSLLGSFVGDALGVPVEFKPRSYLRDNPVTDMIGNGTYNQPAGTWSDDSSMILASMDVMSKKGCYPAQIMKEWGKWYKNAKWTPYNEVFDIGGTTALAIFKYLKGTFWASCGNNTIDGNGNGSLMRAMPVSLWCHYNPDDSLPLIMSSMTHAHELSTICCLYHARLVSNLFGGVALDIAMKNAAHEINSNLNVITDYTKNELTRILDLSILDEPEDNIKSTGYVVHCLEASLWCLHNTNNFSDAVLKAVNLGDDTDTNACVTGGLAGTIYEDIPQKWIDALAKTEMLQSMVDDFTNKLTETL